jgi:hypothetical protein
MNAHSDTHRRKELMARLDTHPTDIEAAKGLWQLYGQSELDFRSGTEAVRLFGPAAMVSSLGIVSLRGAYQELFEVTGEPPTREVLPAALRGRLEEVCAREDTSKDVQAAAQWILDLLQ